MDTNISNSTVSQTAETVTGDPSKQNTTGRKKNGIIIGAIVASVALVAIILVVSIIAKQSQKVDAFEKARERMLSLSEARNMKLNGSMKIKTPSQDNSISEIDIHLEGQTAGAPTIAAVKVVPEIKLVSGQTISPEVNYIATNGGDIYIKLNELPQSFSQIAGFSYDLLPEDFSIRMLIDDINNQWLMISSEDLEEVVSPMAQQSQSKLVCARDLVEDFGQYRHEIAEIYSAHPYLKANQNGITIESRGNTLYKITIDTDELKNFVQDSQDLKPIVDFAKCMGEEDVTISEISTDGLMTTLPELYMEIDENYDITRVYLGLLADDTEITLDFDISYPDTVSIVEPTEYKNFSDIFEELMSVASDLLPKN